jgi:nucleotide-binding universal stress UspA family protein
MSPSTILVPLDGSPLAERALPFAMRLAQATSARVVLTRVTPLFGPLGGDADLGTAIAAQVYLDEVAAKLAEAGLSVESSTPTGEAASEIVDEARARAADVVVMATHGRSGAGRWLYGSVADAVLRHSPVPVILVPPVATAEWPAAGPPRLLVTLDGSTESEAVLGPAAALSQTLGAELVLLQVVEWPPILYGDSPDLVAFDPQELATESETYLRQVAQRLPGARYRVEIGRPVPSIIDRVAVQEQAALIAMATHGRTGLARLVLGSVATGALRHATVPLLLVRPTMSETPADAEAEPAAAALTS